MAASLQNSLNIQGPTAVVTAYPSAVNTTISTGTTTTIQFDSLYIDSTAQFNTSTYQFLPITRSTTYYFVSLQTFWIDVTATYTIETFINLNGSTVYGGSTRTYTGVAGQANSALATAILPLNGSTDYIIGTFFQNSGGDISLGGGGGRNGTLLNIFKIGA